MTPRMKTRSLALPGALLSVLPALMLGLLLGLPFGTAAIAQPHPPPPHHGGPHEIIRDNAAALGISAETLDAILDLARDARAGREIVLAEVQRARAELELLLRETTPDIEVVYEAIRVLGDAEVALRQYDISVLIDMRAMLTAEQREALADFFPSGPPGVRGPPPPR